MHASLGLVHKRIAKEMLRRKRPKLAREHLETARSFYERAAAKIELVGHHRTSPDEIAALLATLDQAKNPEDPP